MDATESLSGNSQDSWPKQVVKPSVEIIKSFLKANACLSLDVAKHTPLEKRDLWTSHVCEVLSSASNS